jgi:hypothetical protein
VTDCKIEYATTTEGLICGKPEIAECADCGTPICADCRIECCSDSWYQYCFDYHSVHLRAQASSKPLKSRSSASGSMNFLIIAADRLHACRQHASFRRFALAWRNPSFGHQVQANA